MRFAFVPLEEFYVPDNFVDIGTDQLNIDHKEVSSDLLDKTMVEAFEKSNNIVAAIIDDGNEKYFVSTPVRDNKENRLVLFNAAVADPKFFKDCNKVVVYNKAKDPISTFKWSRYVRYAKGGYL